MHLFRLFAAILAVGIAATGASAGSFTAGDIVVDAPWARATAPHAPTGAAYMTLSNNGAHADRLVGAATDAAEVVHMHTVREQDGIMRMRPVEAIELPAGARAELKPGGTHMMLVNLKQPLRQGERVKLILIFVRAGAIEIEVMIRSITARGASAGLGRHGQPGKHGDR